MNYKTAPRRIIRTVLQFTRLLLAWVLVHGRLTAVGRQQRHWVFGGCSNRYFADNSAALFQYVCREHPELDAYWIIDRNSPDVEIARQSGNVLFAGDLKTCIMTLSAEVLAISHGAQDIPGCDSRLCSAFRVRLGHGLTALKKTQGTRLRPVHDRNRQFDLVPVASEAEKANKLEWGFDESKLAITGLARFDKIREAQRERNADVSNAGAKKTIFYLPTWRSWLDYASPAVRAEHFYDHVFGIFRDQRLLDHMEANDIQFRMCPHMGMLKDFRNQSRQLNISRLTLVESYYELSSEIAQCDLLITDYSSVAWDSLYAGTPVLFYQFDHAAFVKERGTHVDLTHDLFGPVCCTSDELVTQITKHWGTESFAALWQPRMDALSRRMFAFSDAGNCSRIVTEILRRVKT